MCKIARNIRLLLVGLLLVAVSSGSPAFGSPLTLQDLDDGQSFSSGDGTLQFGGFSITTSGSITSPLSDFEVVVLADGFDVIGAWSAIDGETGTMRIDYSVTGTLALAEAILSLNGSAVGPAAEAIVNETVGTVAALQVYARDGDVLLEDTVDLGGTILSLDIVKEIQVTGGSLDGAAQISVITQRFEVVPEPGTAALLLLGVGGLLLARRR
jgi:hypothetical protein